MGSGGDCSGEGLGAEAAEVFKGEVVVQQDPVGGANGGSCEEGGGSGVRVDVGESGEVVEGEEDAAGLGDGGGGTGGANYLDFLAGAGGLGDDFLGFVDGAGREQALVVGAVLFAPGGPGGACHGSPLVVGFVLCFIFSFGVGGAGGLNGKKCSVI